MVMKIFNDAHRENLCFIRFSKKNIEIKAWLRLIFFSYVHKIMWNHKFYTFHCPKYRCLNKVILEVDEKWMAKFGLAFVLKQENALSWRFQFNANRKRFFQKLVLGILKIARQISLRLRGNFEDFQYKKIFWKKETFFK